MSELSPTKTGPGSYRELMPLIKMFVLAQTQTLWKSSHYNVRQSERNADDSRLRWLAWFVARWLSKRCGPTGKDELSVSVCSWRMKTEQCADSACLSLANVSWQPPAHIRLMSGDASRWSTLLTFLQRLCWTVLLNWMSVLYLVEASDAGYAWQWQVCKLCSLYYY